MQVLGVDRVVLATPDVDETANRLNELLGISFDDFFAASTETVAGTNNLVSRISPDGQLDLAGPGDGDNEVARFLEENGPGLYGVAFRVADLDEAEQHLDSKGVEPVGRIDWGDFSELFYHPKHFGGMFVLLAEFPHPVTTNVRKEFGEDAIGRDDE
ncbi:VOC family protein [Halorarius halobius]|uniref:VOC family protein n=1 Tax=Halorarius halobius TaxID=2962671 RepID=UPI0020CE58D6|nr:VOC family protein [Halorarius halobius]